MEIPQKPKNRTVIWSSNSTPGYISEENKNASSKKIYVPQCSYTVKHLSTVWETRVRSLGQEDPLEKEMTIHSRFSAWSLASYSPLGCKESDTTEPQLFTIANIWKRPKCASRNERIKKSSTDTHVCVYAHDGILLSHEKEWNFVICNKTDRPGGYYALVK